MRIGKFGKVNELSIDTIRHYMDLGLIVPEKQGGHYFFDERCQNDLELILEFKGMGFSLTEIKMIFHYRNFGKITDYEEDTYYRSLFLDKYEKLDQEISNLVDMKDKLKLKLNQLSAKSNRPNSSIGIDFRVLEMLKCLKCGEQLTLQDGVISRNQIMDGKLSCNCGEEYVIESGILIVGSPKPHTGIPLANNISIYIHETDPIYLENVNKGLHWSKRKIGQVDLHKKVILELGSGVGFFLRTIYQQMPEDCLYIAVDHSLERHQFLKNILERTGSKRQFLFICADFLEIPIQDNSVDVLIDQTGTSNYSFEHEDFLLRDVDSLVKQDGYLLGSYLAFKNFSHKSKIEAKFRDNFIVDKIIKNISELKYKTLEEQMLEPINRGGRYENFFVAGEEIFTYLFFGKKHFPQENEHETHI
jgi:DNA-binding transcriptional MerR regulator/ubiquinone/menaquinone biosynthesis C-methylase UbiE